MAILPLRRYWSERFWKVRSVGCHLRGKGKGEKGASGRGRRFSFHERNSHEQPKHSPVGDAAYTVAEEKFAVVLSVRYAGNWFALDFLTKISRRDGLRRSTDRDRREELAAVKPA